MEQNQSDVLTESLLTLKNKRRKDLLTWWIKVFIWIFLIFGAIAPLGLIVGIMGYNFEISLYGLETNKPISIIGVSLILIYIFKAVTAYSLLKEKNWAVTLGIMDAITGIALCSLAMIYPLINYASGTNFSFRLELLLLIPYLLKMIKIKSEWEKSITF